MAAKVNRALALTTVGLAALGGGFAAWRWAEPASRANSQSPQAGPHRPAGVGRLLDIHLHVAEQKLAVRPALAREELGMLYHANGFLTEAEECWRWLRTAEPKVGRWTYLLADVRHQLGDMAAYEDLLEETVARAPDYAPAWLKLADLRFKSGRLDEAEAAYVRRLAVIPGDPYARLGLARIDRQRGRAAESADAIAALVRDHPGFAPAHNLHAENLAARGDRAAARRHRWLGREAGRFQEADDPWLRQLVGRCYDAKRLATHGTAAHQLGDSSRARSLLERAVQAAPDDPDAYDVLGDLLLKQSDPANARVWLEKGLQVAREQGKAAPTGLVVNLAEATRLTGEPGKALALLDGSIRANDAAELYLARGVMLDALERLPEAEASLREALERSPNDAAVRFNLALVLLQQDRRSEATDHLRAALRQQPTHAKALTILGQLEIEAGRLEVAGDYLEPLFEANPGIPEVLELVGYWRLQAGLAATARRDLAAAERHFREGMEAQPGNPDLPISLAGLLLSADRAEEALAPLATYRQLRPNEAQGPFYAAQALARVGRRAEARLAAQEALQLAEQAGNAAMAERCRELLRQL